jgi:hypothetical protein
VRPLLRAPTCFKRYNHLACRVMSRLTTECRIKQGTSHEGESKDTIAITFYITDRYITWVFKSNIRSQLVGIITNNFKFQVMQQSLKYGHCTRCQFRYHASPGMISLGGICVGRGHVPLHGPTIRQRVGPRHRLSRIVRGITWTKSHKARLSILILSKAYSFMVFLAM